MSTAKLFGKGLPVHGDDPLDLFCPLGDHAEIDGQGGVFLHQTFEDRLVRCNMAAFRADLPIAEIAHHDSDLCIRNEVNPLPVDPYMAVLTILTDRDDGIDIF